MQIQCDFGISEPQGLALSIDQWRLPLCSSTTVLQNNDSLKVARSTGPEPSLQVDLSRLACMHMHASCDSKHTTQGLSADRFTMPCPCACACRTSKVDRLCTLTRHLSSRGSFGNADSLPLQNALQALAKEWTSASADIWKPSLGRRSTCGAWEAGNRAGRDFGY